MVVKRWARSDTLLALRWGGIWSGYERLDTFCQFITLWETNSLQLEIAIEIVDLPIQKGDFP
jgi:hypothetical protein